MTCPGLRNNNAMFKPGEAQTWNDQERSITVSVEKTIFRNRPIRQLGAIFVKIRSIFWKNLHKGKDVSIMNIMIKGGGGGGGPCPKCLRDTLAIQDNLI